MKEDISTRKKTITSEKIISNAAEQVIALWFCHVVALGFRSVQPTTGQVDRVLNP